MPFWNERPATQAEVTALDAATMKRANNLSDVASAASARNNIGANQLALEARFGDLSAATAEVRYLQWPFGTTTGFALRVAVTLEGALLTGDAVIALAIDGVATNPASMTIPLAGSGAGVQTIVTFTSANAMPANGRLSLTVGGANTAAVGASIEATCIF